MFKSKILASLITLVSAAYFSSFAIGGIGLHYGIDLSMDMKDQTEQLLFNDLKLTGTNFPTGGISGISLPIYVTRNDWQRKPVNFGAKAFIDVIPLIDALEVSGNFGVWEYNGYIKYPTSLVYDGTPSGTVPQISDFTATYDSVPITLDHFKMGYLGLKNTPYMKLNIDLTIRKYIVQFPKPLKTLRIHGGVGASLIFATPMLTASLVEDALGNQLNTSLSQDALKATLFGKDDIMKAVVEEIGNQLMTPHWGCHIDLGVMIKIPVIPIGFYVDGKYMIPFGKLDKSVDVGGRGLLLNGGVSLVF